MNHYALSDLPFVYNAFEPHISATIMKLHHGKYHACLCEQCERGIGAIRRGQTTGQPDLRSSVESRQAGVPLMVIDAWEHACHLQYENRKMKFFEAKWRFWNWQDISVRYAAARQCHIDIGKAA